MNDTDVNSKAALVRAYVTTRGILPRQSGRDRDQDEIDAGNALKVVRMLAARGRLDPATAEWLDEHVPGWNTEGARPSARRLRDVTSHDQNARSVQRFVARYGRFPSAAGASGREKELGRWLRNQRQAAKGNGTGSWTPVKENRMNRLLPGWKTGVVGENDIWGMSATLGARQAMAASY